MLYDILNARTKPSDKALYNIWARKLSGGWTEQEITGTLPLTFNAKAGELTDYTIYGTAAGAGVQTESGEPEGYKIPLTLTAGQHSDDYVLYIGDTQLGEEEYVDYAEQKVYKRTANLFNKDNFILANLSLYNETKVTSSTTASIIVMPCEANTQYVISIPNYDSTLWRIGLSDYEIPASNQEYTRIESEKPSGNVSTFTTLATTKNILLQIQKATVDITKNSIMLVFGSTAPAQYIPYLQPTDPPSPLPAITAYAGENTLSSTETVGNVTIKGKIKAVT